MLTNVNQRNLKTINLLNLLNSKIDIINVVVVNNERRTIVNNEKRTKNELFVKVFDTNFDKELIILRHTNNVY